MCDVSRGGGGGGVSAKKRRYDVSHGRYFLIDM